RGCLIPLRSTESNGGGYAGCSRQIAFEPLQLELSGNISQQPPPFPHVLRIVALSPLLIT
ncbi:MAG: hypothetical protein ABIN89_03530, partial [Chitinophagaceae bacterium]